MLSFRDIRFTYPGSPPGAFALDGVCIDVEPGTHVAVLGANGSGKSTLARLANGLLLPDTGEVSVDGMSTRDQASLRAIRSRIGMVFQRPDDQIVATTVEEDVAFGPENLGLDRGELRSRVDAALTAVDLLGMERREPHLLSGGQKQRLVIAGALAMNPSYLVLDEPTSMLDAHGRDDVLAIIATLRASGCGVLHITHDLSDIAGADTMVVLDHGHVVFVGPLEDLIVRGDLLEACGLELPPAYVLGMALRDNGVAIRPSEMNVDGILESLWH